MTGSTVVQLGQAVARQTAAGATMRTLLETRPDGAGLGRLLVDVPDGALFAGTAEAGGELWFVVSGNGLLVVQAQGQASDHPVRLSLGADQGVWMPAGLAYRVQSDPAGLTSRAAEDLGPGLRLDIVTLPCPDSAGSDTAGSDTAGSDTAGTAVPVTRAFADCEIEATGDRQFRVLFGPGQAADGCRSATQFVGEIPPGRAPDHSHPYDETVLVLQGQGIVHIGGASHPLAPGTCTHLPPGLPHCLENSGHAMLRVLGVFHPADSPAAKLPPRTTPGQ
ncbi:MAG TPA: cupin domain-containing protein [Streptosporangiaceae bacterium]|jgi:mannose-6-phosphate isomerase-like protein (cupin superfamily)|nr:cupin domain-containing protein [Streptosporangiaceae bacterium]